MNFDFTDIKIHDFHVHRVGNKSVQFYMEKDEFDLKEFTNEIIEQPEVIESFKSIIKTNCFSTKNPKLCLTNF